MSMTGAKSFCGSYGRLAMVRIERHGVGADQAQRVAVGRRLRAFAAAENHRGARLVDHDDRLAEPLLQRLRGEPRRDVGHRADRDRHDHLDRPVRISLRAGRGGGHAGGEQQQQFFHGVLLR